MSASVYMRKGLGIFLENCEKHVHVTFIRGETPLPLTRLIRGETPLPLTRLISIAFDQAYQGRDTIPFA